MLTDEISSTGRDLMDGLICYGGPSHKVSAEFRLDLCRLHPLCAIPLLAPAGAKDERQVLLSAGTSQGKMFIWNFHCRQNMKKMNSSVIMKKAFDIQ